MLPARIPVMPDLFRRQAEKSRSVVVKKVAFSILCSLHDKRGMLNIVEACSR